MLDRWLVLHPIISLSPAIDMEAITTNDAVDNQLLIDYLGNELLRNYVTPGELEEVFIDLGVPEVVDHLQANKFPTVRMVKNGDFGEALAGALFRRIHRWCVPILKLRYKQKPNQPVQGADILGFRFRSNPVVVGVPEVKTRTRRKLNVGVEACESLARVLEELDVSITFVLARLRAEGNFLATRVARILKEGYVVDRHIVIVHENNNWDDRIFQRVVSTETNKTKLSVLLIPGLCALIDDVFIRAATTPGQRSG